VRLSLGAYRIPLETGLLIPSEKLKSVQPMFSQRDELITLLARNDPASADRLSGLDLAFRKALR
jgi:hypothetical protein